MTRRLIDVPHVVVIVASGHDEWVTQQLVVKAYLAKKGHCPEFPKMATRWGIVGAGAISHDFAYAITLLSSDSHQVVCIAARDYQRAQDFANIDYLKIPKAHGCYEELAKDPDVDVVYIGNTQPYHLETAKLMLSHGKAVVCEKPLTMNTKQTVELISFAKEKGVFLMEGLWSRFFPAYHKLREEIDKGIIGDVMMVRARLTAAKTDRPRYSMKSAGGGCVLNYGVYAIQFALWVYREPPLECKAHGVLNESGAEIACTISMKFSGDRMANFYIEFRASAGPHTAQLVGTKGTFEFGSCIYPTELKGETESFEFPLPKPEVPTKRYNGTTGFIYQAEAVRECLKKGEKESSVMSHKDSLLLAHLVDDVRTKLGVNVDSWEEKDSHSL